MLESNLLPSKPCVVIDTPTPLLQGPLPLATTTTALSTDGIWKLGKRKRVRGKKRDSLCLHQRGDFGEKEKKRIKRKGVMQEVLSANQESSEVP